jgi:hypothetical protein
MNFLEARANTGKMGHQLIFIRKTPDEVVFKCEYCQGEMKLKEDQLEAGWSGVILSKKCSKAPKKK